VIPLFNLKVASIINKQRVTSILLLVALFLLVSAKGLAQCIDVGPTIDPICQGGTSSALGGSFTSPATGAIWSDGSAGGSFTNNGGNTPNTATYTASGTSGPTVILTLIAIGGTCEGVSVTKVITVSPAVAASVSITADANPVCAGSSVTFTATPVGGGSTPTYQWYKNTVAVGTGSSYNYVPLNGDVVYVVMTSNATCATGSPATSSSITMVVSPAVAASVSITADANPVCAGSSVTFTATPVGGGSTPTYQWYKNTVAVGTGSSYNYVPLNGDVVYVVMTSNATCATGSPATSNAVDVTVNTLPVPVITGPASACVNSTGNVYSTAAGMTGYNWAVSAGGTITAGTGTNSITVTWNTSGAKTVSVNYTNSNSCIAATPTVYNVTVNICFKTLNLTSVMLEGLYNGGGTMRQAWDGGGPHWPAGVADHITVELHSSSNYATIVFSATDVPLSTNGTAEVTVPAAYNGSYYITIKHRNSLETTTSVAISFTGSTINQTFGARTNVYGANLGLSPDGHYLIFGGDVNQDGSVDSGDYTPVVNDAFNYISGYFATDIDGNGSIDSGDYTLLVNNSYIYIGTIHP
jgi:hypothetical protein